ncbi:MAG: MBL fold metallo-hydrolase [Acidobacteriota bacterium]
MMDTLNGTTRLIDLRFLGRAGIIGTGVLQSGAGLLLVDPGPSTCFERLQGELRSAGVAFEDLHGLLLTHIHLDHAGVSGTLLREYPQVVVYVHERGAPHMADPAKLVSSARRLYGAEMERLWGEIAPVPRDRIRALAGGEALAFGGRRLRVSHTPGHASHHVSYFDESTGIAFTGDTAGIRIDTLDYVLPPTPPPDIDLEAWQASLRTIRGWRPAGLFVTHFGLKADVDRHLDLVAGEIDAWGSMSRDVLLDGRSEQEQEGRFVAALRRRVAEQVGETAAATYTAAIPFEHCWMGLARYWTKRGDSGGGHAARRAEHRP